MKKIIVTTFALLILTVCGFGPNFGKKRRPRNGDGKIYQLDRNEKHRRFFEVHFTDERFENNEYD